MKLSDFDFDLPNELIATRPARPRSASRLLVAKGAELRDRVFSQLVEELRPGDRLVLNDTRVIPARLDGRRQRQSDAGLTEARIEATLLAPEPDGQVWQAMLKPLKKVRDGEVIRFGERLQADVLDRAEGTARLRFNLTGEAFDAEIARIGAMPLPPYIAAQRPADARDQEDYQTIWARHLGAVAAPTASLHFDASVMEALEAKGVKISHVTLHVGAGTFLPVKVDRIEDHKMHSEWGHVSAEAAQAITQTRQQGGRIIPVGTTALRLIESAATAPGLLEPWKGETDIFISPGYQFKLTDALITNFHLPKSTLLMLVAALMGQDQTKRIYAHAVQHNYRFFSYGDASLLVPTRP